MAVLAGCGLQPGVEPVTLQPSSVHMVTSASTQPLSGQTVSGTIDVAVNADSWAGEVRFYLDATPGAGTPVADDTSQPFDATIDTTALPDGAHHLVVEELHQSAGSNKTATATVDFTVANGGASGGSGGASGGGGGTSTILWKAGMEDGTLNAFSAPVAQLPGMTCGGEYNNGGGDSVASTDRAHTGSYAAKLVIQNVTAREGTRLMRGRCENALHPNGLYYSAWYYFPTHFQTPAGWWNVWQWKSEGPSDSYSRVTFAMDLLDDGNGNMRLRLRDKTATADGGPTVYYPQASIVMPVGRWVHVEGYLYPSDTGKGVVKVWQDGTQLYNVSNVNTIRPSGDSRWSVNNYTSAISPDPAVIYADDFAIGTGYIQ